MVRESGSALPGQAATTATALPAPKIHTTTRLSELKPMVVVVARALEKMVVKGSLARAFGDLLWFKDRLCTWLDVGL